MERHTLSASHPDRPSAVGGATVPLEDLVFLRALYALHRAVDLVREGVRRPPAPAEGAFDLVIASHTALPDEGEGEVDLRYAALAQGAPMTPYHG